MFDVFVFIHVYAVKFVEEKQTMGRPDQTHYAASDYDRFFAFCLKDFLLKVD